MEKKYSATSGGILLAVVGTVTIQLFSRFGVSEVCSNQLVQLLPVVVGGIVAWIDQLKRGQITLGGFHK